VKEKTTDHWFGRRGTPAPLRRRILGAVAAFVATTLASHALALECSPNLATYTPTPTVNWTQLSHVNTAGFRVYWKRAEDALWRGSVTLPATPAGGALPEFWPGQSLPFPVQRLVPVTEQRLIIDIMVVSYSNLGIESPPSSILRMCMPEIWTGGTYR
jgi:hypothetical protein